MQSVLPVNDCYGMFNGHTSRWQMVKQINDLLEPLAVKEGAAYIDLYSRFVEKETGKMNPVYTNDGLHLLGKGYLLWRDIVKPYVDQNEEDINTDFMFVSLYRFICTEAGEGCLCR